MKRKDPVEDPDDELPFLTRKREITEEQIRRSWRDIMQLIRDQRQGRRTRQDRQLLQGEQNQRDGQDRRKNQRRRRRVRAFLVPAVIVLLLAAAAVFVLNQPFVKYKTVETDYGEMEKVQLPDGSRVILNSNSSLRYPRSWDENKRMVWLEGEAFFEVEKKPVTHARFIVRTSRLDVEVLGTVFNVNTGLPGRTEVSLNEGKVVVNTKNKMPGGTNTISLRPGEVAVVEADSFIKRKDVEVTQYSAWINNDFHFDSTPLSEIASLIERKYGYKVSFEPDSLREMQISGDMHAENFGELEKALEVTMKMNLTLRSDTLFINN